MCHPNRATRLSDRKKRDWRHHGVQRALCWALASLAAFTALPARAELLLEGTVAAGTAQNVTAPLGGTVQSASVRAGEWVEQDDIVARLTPVRVYAPMDGTIRGLTAQKGDSAQDGVLSIAPVSKYTIEASVEKAYSDVDTKYVHIGERLYISCTKDGTHRAEGIVTAADGLTYTVETDKGELYMEESVYLYRDEAMESYDRVGKGTVTRTAETTVKGSGRIWALYVEEGEDVERGQLLFETVEGGMEIAEIEDTAVRAAQSGVISQVLCKSGEQVEQGAVLATMYLPETFHIEVNVSEEQVQEIQTGDTADITLGLWTEEAITAAGVVSGIRFVQEADEAGYYQVTIDFSPPEGTRLGMSASVLVKSEK